jgi:hypothetical protein
MVGDDTESTSIGESWLCSPGEEPDAVLLLLLPSGGNTGKYGFTSSRLLEGLHVCSPGVGGSATSHGGFSPAGVAGCGCPPPCPWPMIDAQGCSPAGVGGSAINHGSWLLAAVHGRSAAGVGGSAMCHGCISAPWPRGGEIITPGIPGARVSAGPVDVEGDILMAPGRSDTGVGGADNGREMRVGS